MINRRELAALFAAMPIAAGPHRLNRLDLPDLRINPIDTGDVQIVSISPDGGTLVGIRNRKQLVFIEIDTREEISASEEIPELIVIDTNSIAWSPDGSHLAFSLNAWILAIDSDIFVAEIGSGKVTNLTPEGHEKEADSLMAVGDVIIDMFPVWVDDTTLLYARHEWGSDVITTLVTQNIDEGTPEPVAELSSFDVRSVLGPIRRLADGRVLLSADTDKGEMSIFAIDADGTIAILGNDRQKMTMLVDADETGYIATDPQTGSLWLGSYDDPASQADVRDLFEIEPDIALAAPPVFGPEPGTMAVLLADINQTLLKREAEKTDEVVYLNIVEVQDASIHWVQDRFLVTSRRASWLTDRES